MTEEQAEYTLSEPNLTTTMQNSPVAVIQAAISKGTDLDKLEKLMVLQERWEANEARKAYVSAMASFKANPPDIDKDQKVKYTTTKGVTEYNHASLANVTRKINKSLSEYGLSAAWTTTQDEKGISVTCKITHDKGHCESTTLTAKADDSGGKNSIQAIGSTITYLERYTLLALTGLATREMDDDGKGSEVEYITEEQLLQIESMISENDLNASETYVPRLLEYLKVESLDKLTAKEYGRAISAIELAIKKKAGGK